MRFFEQVSTSHVVIYFFLLLLFFFCIQGRSTGRTPPIIKRWDRNQSSSVLVEVPAPKAPSDLARNWFGNRAKESVLNKDISLNTESTESFPKNPSHWDVLVKETLRPVHQSLKSNVVGGYIHSTRNPFVKYNHSPPIQNHKSHASSVDKTEMKNHIEETFIKILQGAISLPNVGTDYFGKTGGDTLEHVFLRTTAHTLENSDMKKEDNNERSHLVKFQPTELRAHDGGVNRFDENEDVNMKPNSKGVQDKYFKTDANHNFISDSHRFDKENEDILLNVGRVASFMNENKLDGSMELEKKTKNRKTRSVFDSIAHQGAFGGFRGYGAVPGLQKKRPFTFQELLPFLIREMRRKNRNESYRG